LVWKKAEKLKNNGLGKKISDFTEKVLLDPVMADILRV
jgi:hypothetical protein